MDKPITLTIKGIEHTFEPPVLPEPPVEDAFARSNGRCQLCGIDKAEKGWLRPGSPCPPSREITADHILALCCGCYEIAVYKLLYKEAGGSPFHFLQLVKRVANSLSDQA